MMVTMALRRRRPPAAVWAQAMVEYRLPRLLSTNASAKGGAGASTQKDGPEAPPPPPRKQRQSFVQAGHFQPGEWDPETHTNPLYRPKFRSRAKILDAEDFANRPKVGFGDGPDGGEFENFAEAMATPSWLNQADMDQMYNLYLQLMVDQHQKHTVTSHEYVIRVMAQKYNLTAERVAGVVTLKHNEEQYKRDGVPLLEEAAAYMDHRIQTELAEAYRVFNLPQPDSLVEDPVAVSGQQDNREFVTLPDDINVEERLAAADQDEDEEARRIIENHTYIEDKYDHEIAVPLDRDCRQLLHAQQELQEEQQQDLAHRPDMVAIPWPAPAHGARRPRWTYVAQTVNTRERKKAHARHTSYRNNWPRNTIVEEDTSDGAAAAAAALPPTTRLRAAHMADVRKTAWKPQRNVQEFILAAPKQGWMDRVQRGYTKSWGRQNAKQSRRASELPTKTILDDDPSKANDEASSSSSSSSDEDNDNNQENNSSSSSSEEEDESDEEQTPTEDNDDGENKNDDSPKGKY